VREAGDGAFGLAIYADDVDGPSGCYNPTGDINRQRAATRENAERGEKGRQITPIRRGAGQLNSPIYLLVPRNFLPMRGRKYPGPLP
jgi:hypothetical protein